MSVDKSNHDTHDDSYDTRELRPLYERPKFDIDGKTYVSAGVILYTIEYPTLNFLIQRVNDNRWDNTEPSWNWEDLGGKSDAADKSIKDVAFRECEEETNGLLDYAKLEKLLQDPRSFEYRVCECKYMLYFLYVEPEMMEEYNTVKFGTVEKHTGVERTLHWISYTDLLQYNYQNILHPRLNSVIGNIMIHIAPRIANGRPSISGGK